MCDMLLGSNLFDPLFRKPVCSLIAPLTGIPRYPDKVELFPTHNPV